MKENPCPAGTILFTPEQSGEKLYLLKQGRVYLFRITSSGQRLVIRQIRPPEVFGIMGLLGQTTQGNYAEAIEDSVVVSTSRDEILEILKQNPELSIRLLEIVGNRLRNIEERLLEATYCTVREKIIRFILTNADNISGILNGLTHEEIGDIIGATRQTVTETLNHLQTQGLIYIKPKKILIVERKRLEDIISPFESSDDQGKTQKG